MKKALYMDDSYLKEFETKVKSVKDKFVVLEQTAFYPRGGGQPCDTGSIFLDGEEYKVVFVGKFDGEISHEVDKIALKEGDLVRGVIDWDKRYTYMRYHTASHILSGILYKEIGAKITGNQIGLDKLRVDFDLDDMDKELMKKFVEKTNKEISKNLDVKIYYLNREEALKQEGMVKLLGALPPAIKELRIVEIGDVDVQADGGTHVKNTSEIGRLEFVKAENKGKSNRRLIVKLI
ncbi:MAG: alanyl-tRNA editing protein AlaXM [Candidatus Woesearchaeota archaeon]